MITLFNAALELQDDLESKNLPFCFIGGLAVIRWGEIRLTNDIDITLLCGFGNEQELAQQVLKSFKPRISDPVSFAITNRVLLVTSSGGIQVDISLSGLEFEEAMIKRSTYFEMSQGVKLKTCTAEDLIVMKAFSNRPKDWNDIEGIVKRNTGALDTKFIMTQVRPFVKIKEDPRITSRLKTLLQIP